MLDPATDDVLAECSGPTADGRCPVSDAPPYTCTGLHLVGTPGTGGRGVSLTVTACSLDGARSRLPAARHPTARKAPAITVLEHLEELRWRGSGGGSIERIVLRW